ncbi:hypothetical protein ACRV5I_20360 [Bacillus halotolerans]|uniref:hypothetical protein n=1 Tax=Bacillus halotolerans TaxID=260554 RepID=UPI003EBE3CE2
MHLTAKVIVTGIKKKTSAVFFKDLKVGDEFELSYSLNGWYHSAPSIDIYQDEQIKHMNTANQLRNNLANFEVEQIG